VNIDFPKELLLPAKTIFRSGAASDLAAEAMEYGPRGLIVHGTSFGKTGRLKSVLSAFPRTTRIAVHQRSAGEPTLDEVSEIIRWGRDADICWIAGIGGGSVLDLAKASAGLFYAKKPPVFYQEGEQLECHGIPFIAIPTTAGTGSEATPNSVITNPDKRSKLSIRDKSFMARKVILDAGLLGGMPPKVMSYAAMDSFVQAYESFISKNTSWFTEALAFKAIGLINSHILPAYKEGKEEDLAALLLASYLGGIALASSRLGVIHGLAHPLGALYGIPHGLICSVLFIPSIKVNKEAMGEKYRIMSDLVGGDLETQIKALLSELGIRSPFKGKAIIEKEKIIAETLSSGSTAANPRAITRDDAEYLLGEIF
jgi:alcohol dehydrogenase class IV